jgi:hypothetical protein
VEVVGQAVERGVVVLLKEDERHATDRTTDRTAGVSWAVDVTPPA